MKRKRLLSFAPGLFFEGASWPSDGDEPFFSMRRPSTGSDPGSGGSAGSSPTPIDPDAGKPKQSWFLKSGTNCIVTLRIESGVDGGSESYLLVNDETKIEKFEFVDVNGELGPPHIGETWLCRVLQNEAGEFLRLQPLRLHSNIELPSIWLSNLNKQLLQVGLSSGINIMLIGEQGCGKTTVAEAVANYKKWQFRMIAGNTIKKYHNLLGQNIPIVVDGQQRFEHEYSQLVKVLLEANENPAITYCAFLDEFNRIDEKGQDVLLNIVSGKTRVLHLPTGLSIPVGSNIRFMAACNEGNAFTVAKSDAAGKDRWMIVKMGYMPAAVEVEHCLRLYPDCPPEPLIMAIAVINGLRAKKNDIKLRLSHNVSTRCAENVAQLLSCGIALKETLLTAVANQYEGTESDVRSEYGRVAAVLASALAR